MMNNESGLQLCARYACKPNKLHYCGKDSAINNIYNCIVNGVCEPMKEEYNHFKALDAYLCTFAEKFGKDKYDYEIIEAYWIGNDLLNKFTKEDFEILLKNFEKHNLPDFFIEEQRKNFLNTSIPFIPLHLFNVLYVGVGKITGSVKYNIENINNCMIRWGEIKEISIDKIKAELTYLEEKNDNVSLNVKDEEVFFEPDFFKNLKVGQIISVHWNSAAKVLNKKEKMNLEKYTKIIIEEFNKVSTINS